MPTRVQIPWPRLAAEFFVIRVGVLVALGVDHWAQNQEARALEAEYLERLLGDVRYDVEELVFIRDRSRTNGSSMRRRGSTSPDPAASCGDGSGSRRTRRRTTRRGASGRIGPTRAW